MLRRDPGALDGEVTHDELTALPRLGGNTLHHLHRGHTIARAAEDIFFHLGGRWIVEAESDEVASVRGEERGHLIEMTDQGGVGSLAPRIDRAV